MLKINLIYEFKIWCSSVALFDNAKFSWYNLIDILFINKLKFPWSSKGACVLKKGYNWKTGAHLRKKKPQFKITLTCTILNLTILLSKFSYLVRFHVKFCLIINLLIFTWHLKFLSLKIVFFFLFQSPFYDILNQCKQQHGTSFVYTIKNCQLCILLITLNTDNQTYVDHQKCIT